MKGFKASINITVCLSLISASFSAFAADTKPSRSPTTITSPDTTERGYNQFCSSGAESMMKKLNDLNEDKANRIDALRLELKDIEEHRELVKGVMAIRNNYIESLAKLEREQARAKESRKLQERAADHAVADKVDTFKSVIMDGMIINAISLLMKNTQSFNPNDPASFTKDNLCKSSPTTEICQKDSFFSSIFTGQKLDKIIKAFGHSYGVLSKDKQADAKAEINTILNSIPEDIKPEAVLKLLSSQSPEVSQLLTSELPREKILECLEDKKPFSSGACEGIAANEEKRAAIIKAMTPEASALQFSDPQRDLIREAAEEVKSRADNLAASIIASRTIPPQEIKHMDVAEQLMALEKATNRADSKEKLNSGRIPASGTSTCSGAKNNLRGMSLLFFKCPNVNVGYDDYYEQLELAQENAKKDAEYFNSKCQKFDTTTDESILKACKEIIAESAEKIEAFSSKFSERAKNIQNEIANISNDGGRYGAIENMKKYVAEKYIRSCNKKTDSISVTDNSIRMLNCNNEVGSELTLRKIYGLGDDVADVIANSSYGRELNFKRASSNSAFSPNETRAFAQTCESASEELRSSFGDVCSLIASENKVAITREKKEQAYNDPNYYYDSDLKSNTIIKTKKKSALRVFGEGVLPVAPTFIPMWFNNYQTKQNISMLTDQAIYQKQMLHTFDVYNSNPWMYNYNYFGYGNYGLGSTTTTTSSTGFNFGL